MKSVLLVSLLAAMGLWGAVSLGDAPPPFAPFATVTVAAGEVMWRPLGNFSHKGAARWPQPVPVAVHSFEIMKFQVSRGEYAICVREGACEPVPAVGGIYPQTHVNWQDATAFARWISMRTGETWKLPSEIQWQLAAAERVGKAITDEGALDPGERMLANYANGLVLRGTASPTLRPAGGFGVNSLGIADIAGNVWEWTDGCMENGQVSEDGLISDSDPYCGVRIAGGRHRAAVIDFVRDASVGGCAVGLPPDHLGFRLVRVE